MDINTPYHLGCPAWSIASWRGTFLPQGTAQSDFLAQYSAVFNTVEGNSFFYALPRLETVERWAEQAAEGFEFCFKVPKELSHGVRLGGNPVQFANLLERLEVIAESGHLGPTFLQLHASFGSSKLNELGQFLEQWPKAFPLAVEVRHPAFFESGQPASSLNDLLAENGVDRVIFDSRALFHAPASDSVEEKSQGRKPNLPVIWTATGMRPMLRFVGRNAIDQVDPWQDEAANVVAKWIHEKKHPYVFMHTPDDTFAPELCRRFHRKLQKRLTGLADLVFPEVTKQMELL